MSDATVLSGNLTLLNRALSEVKSQIGQFLTNEKLLLDAAPRVDNLYKNGAGSVRDTARVLAGKSAALLASQKAMESEALGFVQTASDFKAKIDSDPLYAFIRTPMQTWGIRQGQILAQLAAQSIKLASPAAALTQRLLAQNKDVQVYVGEVMQLEKAATGGGVLPKVERLIGSTLGKTASALIDPLKGALVPLAFVVGGVAFIWATKPAFLKKNPARRKR